MGESDKISFRLPKTLKSFLVKTADTAGMSLTDLCIHLLKSYQQNEDVTTSTDEERDKWQAQIAKISTELEESKQETAKYKQLFQEQRLEVEKYQETVKKAVNDAYKKGYMNGNKQQ